MGKRKQMTDFSNYYVAREPGQREKAYAWATAIGLQAVDGLKPSTYLLQTATRHIEGEISVAEAQAIIDAYYETKQGHEDPSEEEADRVAARMVALVNAPGFKFSPSYLIGLHHQIFKGVFTHAGEIRTVELTKKEWVLDGDSVSYELSCMIEKSLAYDFQQEARFSYQGLTDEAFVEHFAAFISGLWQIHPFREGNTRTTALFAIKYLQSMQYAVSNDLFAKKAWFFRNALVRANYTHRAKGIDKTLTPLIDFFKVLVFDEKKRLQNRFLHVRATADVGINVRINVGINKSPKTDALVKLLKASPHLTIAALARKLHLSTRQVERRLALLKRTTTLHRVGSKKTGHWEF